MDQKTRKAVQQAWKEVQDPSLLYENVRKFSGKQYEIGDVIILKLADPWKANIDKFGKLIKELYNFSTSIYDQDYHSGQPFIIFEKKNKLTKKRVYNKETNYMMNVVEATPYYNAVKIDDPTKIIYSISEKDFTSGV